MKRYLPILVLLGLLVLTSPIASAAAGGKHEGKHQKEGQGAHHPERHTNGPDQGEEGSGKVDGGRGPSHSEQIINLSLVLLVPAAIGLVGGRLLSRPRVKPAS
jgi:hypothetical protein